MRLRAIPRPLAALLAVVFLFGVAWALLVPPGQVPDEASHLQYTQSIAERLELPGGDRKGFSTEQSVALRAALRGDISNNLTKRPQWVAAADERYRKIAEELPRDDGGGYIYQDDNPPLYYAFESVAYWVGWRADFLGRLHLMRIWSSLLLLVATTGAWLLAGELFARDRLLQLATAAVVGLQPMARFISAGVNPDAALIAMWTIALWLGVRILNRGLTVRDGVALGVLAGAGVWVKASGWALLPAAAFALLFGWLRLRARGGPRTARPLALSLSALAASALAWVVTATALGRHVVNYVPPLPGHQRPSLTSLHTLRDFASYVWQFYLPKLPGQNTFWRFEDTLGGERFYNGWLRSGWGTFGWLDARMPEWSISLLAIACAVAILGGVAALVRAHLAGRVDPAHVAFLFLAGLGLLTLLHWADYNLIVLRDRAIEQGRYLFPILAVGGLSVAGAISLLRQRWRGVAVGVLLAALVTLELASLGVTMERYFA